MAAGRGDLAAADAVRAAQNDEGEDGIRNSIGRCMRSIGREVVHMIEAREVAPMDKPKAAMLGRVTRLRFAQQCYHTLIHATLLPLSLAKHIKTPQGNRQRAPTDRKC